jgi:hypothetical protein
MKQKLQRSVNVSLEDEQPTTLGQTETVDEDEIEDTESVVEKVLPVPQSKYGSVNLKKYKSFKSSRVQIKLSNQEVLSKQELTQWLSNIDVSLNQLNAELLVDVYSFAYAFFIYGSKSDREQSINRVVESVLLPYFKNDVEVLRAIKQSNEYKIVKSTAFSRRLSKMKNTFFFVLEMLLKSS